MKKLTLCAILFPFLLLYPQQSKLSHGVNYISEFIASDYFSGLKSKSNDLQLVDTIFVHAVKYYNNNIDEALLAITFAAITYRKIPIQVPVFKWVLLYPLISAGDSIFYKKNKNLPSQFYFDTPQNAYGDKDKIAHFFGSAYISYKSNIFDLGNLIGYFVEVFEENFKIQSHIDQRDLGTNKLGNLFGEVLKKNKNILPSQILLIPAIKNFTYCL